MALRMHTMMIPLAATALCFAVSGCGSSIPSQFIRGTEPRWESVTVRAGLTYDQAWQQAVYLLAKRFDLDMISKPDGYARTSWMNQRLADGVVNESYRYRAIVEFTPDRKKLEFKVEAQQLEEKVWRSGADTLMTYTLKKDLLYGIGQPKTK